MSENPDQDPSNSGEIAFAYRNLYDNLKGRQHTMWLDCHLADPPNSDRVFKCTRRSPDNISLDQLGSLEPRAIRYSEGYSQHRETTAAEPRYIPMPEHLTSTCSQSTVDSAGRLQTLSLDPYENAGGQGLSFEDDEDLGLACRHLEVYPLLPLLTVYIDNNDFFF